MTEYDSDYIEQIIEKIDLAEYIGQSIDLEHRGKEYYGSCPNHIDETPSFSVNPRENLYYCFSCHSGGNILSYLMEYEHLSYDQAVQKAAKLAHVDLSSMCQSESLRWLKRIKRKKRNKPKERAILDESILNKYERRYPDEWLTEGISKNAMEVFDIRIDNRSNRIVYPVRNRSGQLINVKGRTRIKNYKIMKLPKYQNYYEIGDVDYLQCLNVTERFIKEKKEIILFESIKSVMKAYAWGYKNCVSIESHNLSEGQIKLLIALQVDVVLALDSDVDFRLNSIKDMINILKKYTNVYLIKDNKGLLGGSESKNSPVDLTKEVWKELYSTKEKVI